MVGRTSDPRGEEGAEVGQPSGCLPGWQMKVSCRVSPSWRLQGWARRSSVRPSTSSSSSGAPRGHSRASPPWVSCSPGPPASSGTEMSHCMTGSLSPLTHLPQVTGPTRVFVVHLIAGSAEVLKYSPLEERPDGGRSE